MIERVCVRQGDFVKKITKTEGVEFGSMAKSGRYFQQSKKRLRLRQLKQTLASAAFIDMLVVMKS